MVLRFEPDVSQADWVSSSRVDWVQLCSFGPSRYPRHVRLFHPLPPHAGPDDRLEVLNLEGHPPQAVLDRLVGILELHTETPEDCFFALWEGFGEIHGSPAVTISHAFSTPPSHWPERPSVPPAFSADVMTGPRLTIPHRSYLLFRGPLREAGHWGAADLIPGHARPINSPNLMWPADRAWFVATEIDLPWTSVGGSAELIEALLADEELDAEPITPSPRPPYWRGSGRRP